MYNMEKDNDGNDLPSSTKKFGELMRAAIEENPEYEKGLMQIKPVDYSFMHEELKGKNRRGVWKTTTKVAAILVCFFVSVMGMSIFLNSEPATAMKFGIKKKFYDIKNGLFVSNENQRTDDYSDSNTLTFEIDSMNEIEKAVKFEPKLYIPEYIPKGYKLDTLKIMKDKEEDYIATYKFTNTNNEYFAISLKKIGSDDSDVIVPMNEIVKNEDGIKIGIWENKESSTHGATAITDEHVISIRGGITQEEMIEIAKYLQIQ